MKMYSAADADISKLAGERIAVLGYGSQGRAQALNLRDSGLNVVVGLRAGSGSRALAERDGFAVQEPTGAVAGAAIVAMLAPDMALGRLYKDVSAAIDDDAALLFAHGFAVQYRLVQPRADLDVVLVAPKGGPGKLVRRYFEQGFGVPCLVAVAQDASGQALSRALAYAAGIGGAHAGMLETTFAEESETDMFGEQAVLCGGVTELVLAGFETLVEAGYQPEVAYYEVLHELKLVTDLMHEGGLHRMYRYISDTAAWGSFVSGRRVIGDAARDGMAAVLADIRDGSFARRWIAENDAGMPEFRSYRDGYLAHPIEAVGARLRERMRWLEE